jgi:hypothetical protein
MGLSNWLFQRHERELSRATELRKSAASNPKRADVAGLVDVLDGDPDPQAGRLALQGLTAVAAAYPERLRPVVPDLIVATSVEGPVPDHRGMAAEALATVVDAHPESVTQYVNAVDDSLHEEAAATGAVTVGVTFDERTIDALCRVLSAADTDPARRSLRDLAAHEHPVVGDAAAQALSDTSDPANRTTATLSDPAAGDDV